MATSPKTLGVCLGLALLCLATHVEAQTVFDQNGFGANRGSYTVLPYEYVDPLSGNLILVVTDLTLPGNAGFNLPIQRVYNSAVYPDYESGSLALEEDSWAGIGWRLHFGRVLHEDDNTPGATQIEMSDGSRHPLYHYSIFGNVWITKEFWLYNKNTHTLMLPNGTISTFGRSVFLNPRLGTVRYVTEMHDPFANSLTFTYFDANGPPDGIAQIHQDLGQGQARDVTFGYEPLVGRSLRTMTYNGMTWTYIQVAFGPPGYTGLVGVTPPVGLPWGYDYEATPGYVGLARMRVPGGGIVDYTYGDANRVAGSTTERTRVVTTRTISGDRITPGSWTFQYGQGANQDTSIVSCPCGTTSYRYNGIGVNGTFSGWLSGTLAERTISDNGTVLQRETFDWAQSEQVSADAVPGTNGLWSDPAVYNALPVSHTITRGTQSWTTTSEYHTGDGSYNDYNRPFRVTETGNGPTRTTTQTFDYAFDPYIIDRIASQSVTIGGETVTVSFGYDHMTGFTTSQNAVGVITSFQPTAQGNLRWIEDANGHRTTFTYQWGMVENTTSPVVTSGRVIDPSGLVLSETLGPLTTRYEYDAGMRLKTIRPPNANPIGYEYDDLNQGWIRVARDQAQTSSQLDGFGRIVHTTNRLNLQTRVTRDACGRATFSSAPYTTGTGDRGVTTQYDALGRVTQMTAADGASTTRFSYDGIDVTTTDAANRASYQHYVGIGGPGDTRLIWVQDVAHQQTTYAYDVLGHLIDVLGPVGPGTTPHRSWVYNAHGWLDHDTQPESGTTSYQYDAVGNLTRVTDANGAVTVLTYDANNRLTSRDADGTDADVTLTYDAIGRLATQQTPLVSTTFGYDTSGRLASRTDQVAGLSKTSSYLFDNNDNLTQITYPSGRLVGYAYDIERRLTSVSQNGVAFAGSFTYDDSGRLSSYATGPVTHGVAYDVRDRVSRLTSGVPGSPELDLTYHYDAISRVLGIDDLQRPAMTQSFGYDDLDRLTSANGAYGALAWSYDAAGNRTSDTRAGTTTSYAYDPPTLRLTSLSGGASESFTYDNVGRLTSDSRGRYSYLPTGLLRRVTDAATGLTQLGQYTYDASNLRVRRDVSGRSVFSFRSAGGQTLSEYETQCSATVWTRDLIYAGGRLLGAVKANQDLPTITWDQLTSTTTESAGTPSFAARLTTATGAPLTCPVTVAYATQPLTGPNAAQPGADYVATNGTLTFAAGTPSGGTQSAGVSILNDNSDEPDEVFALVLSNPIGATITSATRTITIQDDDGPPTLSMYDVTVNEASGWAVFWIYLSAPSGFPITVNYATEDESAHVDHDYLAASGTLTIPAGSTGGGIGVPIVNDSYAEPTESFILRLSNPVNGTLAWPASRGTITDDDGTRVPIDTSLPGNYFADGTAVPGYDDYVLVGNRHPVPVTARVTYTRDNGTGATRDVTVPAGGRLSFRVGDEPALASGGNVSIAVQTTNPSYPLDADHSVYWGPNWQGGRSTEGVSPSQSWYFAEGSVGYSEEYLTVFNPSPTAQDCYVDFWGLGGGIRGDWHHVEAGPGRERIRVHDLIGDAGDHGSRIWCSAPVVAERTMTWQRGVDEREGHSSPGAPAGSTTWYFAEGNTGFSTVLALFNLECTPNTVRIEYLHENGTAYTQDVTIGPCRRVSLTTPNTIPLGSYGYRITSLSGVQFVAERSMYYGSDLEIGTSGVGSPALSTSWNFEEGGSGPFWDTFILLANPSATTANVSVAFTRADGAVFWTSLQIAPNQRQTIQVDVVPGVTNANFKAQVFSDAPIVAERATYWPGDGLSQLISESLLGTTRADSSSAFSVSPQPAVRVRLNPYTMHLPRAAAPTQMYPTLTPTATDHVDSSPPATNTGTGTGMKLTPDDTTNVTSGGLPWYGGHVTLGRRP